MARTKTPLYVGTGGIVAALDPANGEELWRTKLPKSAGATPVTIVIKGDCLYVGCHGQAYGLDARTGDILWQNGLPKMGYDAVLLAMEGATGSTSVDAVLAEVTRQQEAAAAAATAGGASTC